MKKYWDMLMSSRIVPLVVFTCLTILAVSAWSSNARSHKSQTASSGKSKGAEEIDATALRLQPEKVPVWNATKSLKLVKLDKVNTWFLELTFQNGYEKRINGIQVALGNLGIFTELMYNEDQMIPPGGTYVDIVPIQANTDKDGVTLLSVHFEDGTADGDELVIKMIDEDRAGQKAQISRVLALIRRALRSADLDAVAVLDELRSQVQDLPTRIDGRPDFSGGLGSGKQRMIAIIDEVRRGPDSSVFEVRRGPGSSVVEVQRNLPRQPDISIRTKLMEIVQQHERVVSKH